MKMAEPLWIGGLVAGPVQTNCYIVKHDENGKEAVLIDPGDDSEHILAVLEKMGAVPTDILLTHGHFDHIMAVNEVKAAFPSCKVSISEAERPMVENADLNSSFFSRTYEISPDAWLKDGDVLHLLGREFRVIATPGHTAGSVCYYVPEDGVLFSGDTVFFESYGRTDLPTGRSDQIFESLKNILTALPGETVILPGHGPQTTAAHERMIEGFEL